MDLPEVTLPPDEQLAQMPKEEVLEQLKTIVISYNLAIVNMRNLLSVLEGYKKAFCALQTMRLEQEKKDAVGSELSP